MLNRITISIVAGAIIIGGVSYTYFSSPTNQEEEQVNEETCQVVLGVIGEAKNFSDKVRIAKHYLELGCEYER